jgi:hypothetical protein
MVFFLIEHFIINNLFFIDTESCHEFNQVNFQILKASKSLCDPHTPIQLKYSISSVKIAINLLQH